MSKLLEKEIGSNQAVILNSGMEVTGEVDWTRAMNLIVSEDAYILIPRSDGSEIRSQTLTFPKPLVICLNKYVKGHVKERTYDSFVSRKTILTRDNYTCVYCDKFGNTIDHVFPKSRGGKNTWANLVTACLKCNSEKRDKTPKEAGMREPKIPSPSESARFVKLQKVIHQELESLFV